MAPQLDYEHLLRSLRARLAGVGSASAPELCAHLGISQPTLSRLVSRYRDEFVIAGKGRATRYAARRVVPDVGSTLPLYEVNETGGTRRLGLLHAVLAEGFWVESLDEDLVSGFFSDLPYFLNELRPQGFLGRQIPRRHAELELPPDVTLWSANHCLRYLARFGWDTVGSWLVDDRSLTAYLEHLDEPANPVLVEERAERYLALCKDALSDAPGSSAGGEQPKFLATRVDRRDADATSVPVLVKFSPPMDERVGRRFGDLLIAEHTAHGVVLTHGVEAAMSELLIVDDRTFLEVVRFDRTKSGGRRGMLSLLALDAEFVGSAKTWAHTAERLQQQGLIDAETTRQIQWAQCFGRLIGNSDMHFGNLSLFTRGTRVLGMAPLYDMLPMMYAVTSGHVTEPAFAPAPVQPGEAEIWDSASTAALAFWRTVSRDERVSAGFRAISDANAVIIEKWRRVAQLGPWS